LLEEFHEIPHTKIEGSEQKVTLKVTGEAKAITRDRAILCPLLLFDQFKKSLKVAVKGKKTHLL